MWWYATGNGAGTASPAGHPGPGTRTAEEPTPRREALVGRYVWREQDQVAVWTVRMAEILAARGLEYRLEDLRSNAWMLVERELRLTLRGSIVTLEGDGSYRWSRRLGDGSTIDRKHGEWKPAPGGVQLFNAEFRTEPGFRPQYFRFMDQHLVEEIDGFPVPGAPWPTAGRDQMMPVVYSVFVREP